MRLIVLIALVLFCVVGCQSQKGEPEHLDKEFNFGPNPGEDDES